MPEQTLPGKQTGPTGGRPARHGGRFQTGRVLTIGGVHAVHDTYTGFLPPLLPIFVEKFALARAEAGLLSVFVQAPSLIQPFIGHLADRISLRYFVIFAPAVTAVAMSLLGVASGYGPLVLLLLIAGLSSASLHAVGPVMAGRLAGPHLGRAMGIWMVGGELGRTLGPIVIVSAVAWLTFEDTVWLMPAGIVASGWLYLRLRDVPGRPPAGETGLPWRTALRAMGPLLLPLSLVLVARAFVVSALTTYLPLFLKEEGANLWMAGASLTVLEGAGVVGALLGGTISDHLGRRRVLFASMALSAGLMLLFLPAAEWARFPLLVLLGFTTLAVTPVIMALVQENFPTHRALANGVYMSLSFGIRAVVVVLLGGLGDLFGMRWAFGVSAGVGLLGLIPVLALPGRPGSGAPRDASRGG